MATRGCARHTCTHTVHTAHFGLHTAGLNLLLSLLTLPAIELSIQTILWFFLMHLTILPTCQWSVHYPPCLVCGLFSRQISLTRLARAIPAHCHGERWAYDLPTTYLFLLLAAHCRTRAFPILHPITFGRASRPEGHPGGSDARQKRGGARALPPRLFVKYLPSTGGLSCHAPPLSLLPPYFCGEHTSWRDGPRGGLFFGRRAVSPRAATVGDAYCRAFAGDLAAAGGRMYTAGAQRSNACIPASPPASVDV